MGLACHLCRQPFHGTELRVNVAGAGRQSGRYTISVTTCGHMFHVNCLKKHFELQRHQDKQANKRAWLPKKCPECRKEIDVLQNVIRVEACPCDEATWQGKLTEHFKQQLMKSDTDRQNIERRYQSVLDMNVHLENENTRLRKERDDLAALNKRIEYIGERQMERIESYKADNERLKNDVQKLSDINTLRDALGAFSLQDKEVEQRNELPKVSSSEASASSGFMLPVSTGGGRLDQHSSASAFKRNNLSGNFGMRGSQIKYMEQPYQNHTPGFVYPFPAPRGSFFGMPPPYTGNERPFFFPPGHPFGVPFPGPLAHNEQPLGPMPFGRFPPTRQSEGGGSLPLFARVPSGLQASTPLVDSAFGAPTMTEPRQELAYDTSVDGNGDFISDPYQILNEHNYDPNSFP